MFCALLQCTIYNQRDISNRAVRMPRQQCFAKFLNPSECGERGSGLQEIFTVRVSRIPFQLVTVPPFRPGQVFPTLLVVDKRLPVSLVSIVELSYPQPTVGTTGAVSRVVAVDVRFHVPLGLADGRGHVPRQSRASHVRALLGRQGRAGPSATNLETVRRFHVVVRDGQGRVVVGCFHVRQITYL